MCLMKTYSVLHLCILLYCIFCVMVLIWKPQSGLPAQCRCCCLGSTLSTGFFFWPIFLWIFLEIQNNILAQKFFRYYLITSPLCLGFFLIHIDFCWIKKNKKLNEQVRIFSTDLLFEVPTVQVRLVSRCCSCFFVFKAELRVLTHHSDLRKI